MPPEPQWRMFPATCLWTSSKTRALGTHRKFGLDFFCFVLFRLISSNLQLLQNFSVTCICDILYDILLCLRRKEEELFSWEILDAIETAYTNGVSAGSTQRKVCDSDGEKY